MSNSSAAYKPAFPILSILFLIFMTLKLAGIGVVANWSWWAVTAPLWAPLLLVIGIMGCGVLLYVIAEVLDKRSRRKAHANSPL